MLNSKLVGFAEGLLENTLGVVACEEKRSEVVSSIKDFASEFFWGEEIHLEDKAWKQYLKQKELEEKVVSFPQFERFEFVEEEEEEVVVQPSRPAFHVIDGGRE